MWVGRVQVHLPTAGTQLLTASVAANSPSCPGKITSGKQHPAVGGGVVLSIHGDRFKVLLVAPCHPTTHTEQCH